MADITVVKACDLTTSDFKYVAPKMNASGGKSIGILNSKVIKHFILKLLQ